MAVTTLSSLKCVVLGANGFIGSNLCRALVGKAAEVRAFGRTNRLPAGAKPVTWMSGDFSNASSVEAAVSGCDVVFHLISTSTPATANSDMVADVVGNVIPTLQLLDICRRTGNPRIIFVSTGGAIYGPTDWIPTPERVPSGPIGAYGITKLAIEGYLALYDRLHGVPYRTLRVANAFGPFQTGRNNQGVVATCLKSALTGSSMELWGDGSVVRDYIYIDDVIDALMLTAVHEGPSRLFNVGSGVGRAVNEVIGAVEELTRRPVLVHRRQARGIDIPRSVLDISLAKSELGWQPRVPFLEGLQRTLNWLETLTDLSAHISPSS